MTLRLVGPGDGRVQCEGVGPGTPSPGLAGQLSFDDELAVRDEEEQSFGDWVMSLPLDPWGTA